MDTRSEALLAHVEPDLARVLRAAAQLPQPFVVVYGIRTIAAEAAACAAGNSQTMHSRHLPRSCNGLSAAVDIWALVNGRPDPARGNEKSIFGEIAAQIKSAAATLAVPLEWGGEDVGAWVPGEVSHFHDWGHFQLPWREYP